MTLKEVYWLLAKDMGLKVTYHMVYYWLRRKFRLRYGKPYVVSSKRPVNAEEELRKELEYAVNGLSDFILVFMDETSFRANPSVVRVFDPRWQEVEVDNRRLVLFGGLALNGISVVLKAEKANSRWFSEFLVKLREANGFRPILLVLDNASYHWSAEARSLARYLGIRLAYLPPYSPDLNPIEFLWRDLKRLLAFSSFETIDSLVCDYFIELASSRRYSYAKSWLEKFGDIVEDGISLKVESVLGARA